MVGDPSGRADPRRLAVGEGFVGWRAADNTVTRIEPSSGEVVGGPIPIGDDPYGIAVARHRLDRELPRRNGHQDPALESAYGVVVESVNVSVLLYVPVRRASLAPIACLNVTVTESFEIGAA